MRSRNNQKQIWVNLEDLIRFRTLKLLKNDGRIETDAELFSKVVMNVKKDKRQIKRELDVRFDGSLIK